MDCGVAALLWSPVFACVNPWVMGTLTLDNSFLPSGGQSMGAVSQHDLCLCFHPQLWPGTRCGHALKYTFRVFPPSTKKCTTLILNPPQTSTKKECFRFMLPRTKVLMFLFLGGVTNILAAELFTQTGRPAAYIIGGSVNWLSFFLIGMTFPFIVVSGDNK